METEYHSPIDDFTKLEFVEEKSFITIYMVSDNGIDMNTLSIDIPKDDIFEIIAILRKYRKKRTKNEKNNNF